MNQINVSDSWVRKFFSIITAFSLVVGTMLPSVAIAAAGSLQTTHADCAVVNGNVDYVTGDHVWLRADNLEASTIYEWWIETVPAGGLPIDSGTIVTDADGAFCFDAHTILAGEDGVYKANVGISQADNQKKSDNYSVTDTSVQTWSISGSKFNDLNSNGVWDQGEVGIEGWTINLDMGDDDTIDQTTVTDVNGDYTFTGLANGPYTVTETQQQDWTQTAPVGGEYNVEVDDEDVIDRDFGNHFDDGGNIDPCSLIDNGGCTISGIKFNDIDGNGIYDSNVDSLLEGWTIYVDVDLDGTLSAGDIQVDTAVDGSYSLAIGLSGTYVIREELVSGWTQTLPGALADLEYSVVVDGASEVGVDFGNNQNDSCSDGSISGFVFDDDNENSVWDEGEDPLNEWTVYLDLDNSGSLDEGEPTMETDAEGAYSFTGLAEGQYFVREVVQSNWKQITPGEESNFAHTVDLVCPVIEIQGFQFLIAAVLVVDNTATGIDFGNNQVPSGGGGGSSGGGGGGGGGGGTTPPPPVIPPVVVIPDTAGDQIEDEGEVLGEEIGGESLPVTGTQVGYLLLMTLAGYALSLLVKRQVATEKK